MLAAQRRQIILDRIYDEKRVIVSELSKEFDVSEETIRRDLDKLEDEGHVIKSYGGAVLNEKSSIELPFNVRRKSNLEGKEKIAKLLLNEIDDGDHIILDASTTAVFIAKSIKIKKDITVITNSIENILELSDAKSFTVICTGGALRPGNMSLQGAKAAEGIAAYNADKIIFSCKGLDLEKGVTDGNDETAAIKQAMLSTTGEVYLAVDSSKFGKIAFSTICELGRPDVLVTDKKPDDEFLESFERNGIRCIYPKE